MGNAVGISGLLTIIAVFADKIRPSAGTAGRLRNSLPECMAAGE